MSEAETNELLARVLHAGHEYAWVLPPLKQAYAHGKDIKPLWEKVCALYKGKKSSLAITGFSGVGKSVLYDHLRGEAPRLGYHPPGISGAVEERKITSNGRRLALHVIPGQYSATKLTALDDVFTGKVPVDGVIHVVCNGFATLRESTALEIARRGGIKDINEWLAIQRQEELAELKQVTDRIEQSHRKHASPKWMLVALAKYDLFYADHDEAIRYYLTDTGSPFVAAINEMVRHIGTNQFEWSVSPVSTYLDRYVWPSGVVAPQLTEPERDHFLTLFVAELEKFCCK